MIRLQAERLLEKGDLSAANEESVQVQLEEVSRLSQIIEELLFLSRAETREIELNLAKHDPEVILGNFLQDARVLTEHHGVRFEQSHVGSGVIFAEPRWLRRVLLNMLTNALKASPVGGCVTLSSRIESNIWKVSLDDQGTGVPKEYHEKIFERFFRLQSGKESDETGSGLGLAICRSIVYLHRGKMWAEGAPESTGLRVVFTIPTAH
jgi:two-component system heavy metal sensor histidine kinase CusS